MRLSPAFSVDTPKGSVRRRSPQTDRTSPGGESASGSRVREPARWHREKEGRSGTLFGTRSRSTWVCWASCGVWGSCSPRPTPSRGDGPGTSRDTHEGPSRLARTRSGTGAGGCHRALAARGLPRLGWRGGDLSEKGPFEPSGQRTQHARRPGPGRSLTVLEEGKRASGLEGG